MASAALIPVIPTLFALAGHNAAEAAFSVVHSLRILDHKRCVLVRAVIVHCLLAIANIVGRTRRVLWPMAR